MNRRNFIGGGLSLAATARYIHAETRDIRCDVAVIGGGTGGVAAALGALRTGVKVTLTEETDWIGGQLTSQAVPPDENPWIEDFGSTLSYRDYRTAVREFYRRNYPLTDDARKIRYLNPGNGFVSRLTHEFRVSVAVLEAMLQPYLSSGQLTLLLNHAPVAANMRGDEVQQIMVRDLNIHRDRAITARYFIDATELGELLPLTKTEHVTGAESRAETGELHARENASPSGSQPFTFGFAMDYLTGEDHTIDRPAEYQRWRNFIPKLTPPWSGRLLSWTGSNYLTYKPSTQLLDPNPTHQDRLNLWLYRRIACRAYMKGNSYRSDITLVNWPQNDYTMGDLNTASSVERAQYLHQAKQQALSLMYWMQTEAPRPDGGAGFKGLRLRRDIVDTIDGLAKYPYIRESRRIKAQFTVLESHIGTEMRMKVTGKTHEEVRAAVFQDTVGIGSYRIDLHPSADGFNYVDLSSLPFQIPLGSLLPVRVRNLIAGCKNIGTTHVSNGCFRLHPVEWNIGEAAGCVAAYAIATKQTPEQIRNDKKRLSDFQAELVRQGFELSWPTSVHPV